MATAPNRNAEAERIAQAIPGLGRNAQALLAIAIEKAIREAYQRGLVDGARMQEDIGHD